MGMRAPVWSLDSAVAELDCCAHAALTTSDCLSSGSSSSGQGESLAREAAHARARRGSVLRGWSNQRVALQLCAVHVAPVVAAARSDREAKHRDRCLERARQGAEAQTARPAAIPSVCSPTRARRQILTADHQAESCVWAAARLAAALPEGWVRCPQCRHRAGDPRRSPSPIREIDGWTRLI